MDYLDKPGDDGQILGYLKKDVRVRAVCDAVMVDWCEIIGYGFSCKDFLEPL